MEGSSSRTTRSRRATLPCASSPRCSRSTSRRSPRPRPPSLTVSELARRARDGTLPERAVAITFDDAFASVSPGGRPDPRPVRLPGDRLRRRRPPRGRERLADTARARAAAASPRRRGAPLPCRPRLGDRVARPLAPPARQGRCRGGRQRAAGLAGAARGDHRRGGRVVRLPLRLRSGAAGASPRRRGLRDRARGAPRTGRRPVGSVPPAPRRRALPSPNVPAARRRAGTDRVPPRAGRRGARPPHRSGPTTGERRGALAGRVLRGARARGAGALVASGDAGDLRGAPAGTAPPRRAAPRRRLRHGRIPRLGRVARRRPARGRRPLGRGRGADAGAGPCRGRPGRRACRVAVPRRVVRRRDLQRRPPARRRARRRGVRSRSCDECSGATARCSSGRTARRRARRERPDWRLYDRSTLVATLERAGFRCRRASYVNVLGSAAAAVRGRHPTAPTGTTHGIPAPPRHRRRPLTGLLRLEGELVRRGVRLPFGHTLVALAEPVSAPDSATRSPVSAER